MISVSLPANRWHPGTLSCAGWSCPVLGLADQKAATLAGNEHRDPLRPLGDTPLGRYRATFSGPFCHTPQELRSYGPHRVLALEPLDGDALKAAKNGRSGFMIHGGAPAADGVGLRPTHGCLRLSDDDMAHLISLLEATGEAAFTVEVLQAA